MPKGRRNRLLFHFRLCTAGRQGEFSRLCRSAGVLRMRILHDGRVRFCVCRPPKSKKRRFALTSCVFCRVRAWMFRHLRQLAPRGHRTAARRRKLAQPRRRKPRYVMGNRLLFHLRLCRAGRQGGFPGFVGQPVPRSAEFTRQEREIILPVLYASRCAQNAGFL